MSPELVGFFGILLLLVLIFLRIWVGVALALVGFLGYGIVAGWQNALIVAGTEPFLQISAYSITCIPLFILMGALISNSGIGADLYNTASKWVGNLRGGLAMATIIACGGFSAVSGSSLATGLTMAKIAHPEMKRYKYDSRLAVGSIAVGGTLGILIPPSLGFILYGLLTQESIGRLFIAGILPGILLIVLYMITIYIMCLIRPDWAPQVPRSNAREKIISLKYTWPILVLFIVVIGGIYLGIFTPTEAGAIGAFGAIVISFIAKKIGWDVFKSSLTETAKNTAMIVLMLAGAFIFMRFITVSEVSFLLSDFVQNLNVSKYVLLLFVIVFYLIVGCIMDTLVAVILTLPIIYPIIEIAGFDLIWFGVVMVRLMEIGMITPPMGIQCFVISKAINVPLGITFRGISPFLIADAVHIGLLIAIPDIALLLIK